VQINLSDEELWRAIADNTDALSAVIEQQIELGGGNGGRDAESRAKLMRTNAQLVDIYQREYRDMTAEIRRRYPDA